MTRSTPLVIAAPGVSVSEGEVDQVRLREFGKHGSQFSLVTGELLQLPAIKATPGPPGRRPIR